MPTTFEALAIFLLFSVPAYLSITLFKRKNPGYYFRNTESTVEEVALYLFLGTIVNVFSLLTFSFLLWIATVIRNYLLVSFINNIDNWVASFEKWFLALCLFILYSFIGLLISIFISDKIYNFMPDNPPMFMKELNKLRVTQRQSDSGVVWILVRFKNGDSCLGLASEVRWVGDKDNSIELSLEKTYYQNSNNQERYAVGRVVIRSDDVLWLGPYTQVQ